MLGCRNAHCFSLSHCTTRHWTAQDDPCTTAKSSNQALINIQIYIEDVDSVMGLMLDELSKAVGEWTCWLDHQEDGLVTHPR